MSSISRRGPSEPDAFSPSEFAVWRGTLRLHATVTRALERRLAGDGHLSLGDYSILITLVGVPGRRLPMSELARRRLLHPSRITRVVDKLEREGLIVREPDPSDARSVLAALTERGLRRVRAAQPGHHETVRRLYLHNLSERELATLARLLDKAMPGVVSADVWPPAGQQL